MMAIIYPNVVNHIGISVPDLEKAIDFYSEVIGFNIIKGPVNIVPDTPGIGLIGKNIFGPQFKEVKIAWLNSGNNVGLEIFQFIDPKAELRSDNFEYWKSGFFHICITDPNIEDLCNKILEKGGKMRADVQMVNEVKQHKIAYLEDPFGNIIEIFTRSYEQFNANT
jgi:catechol 2,3-dioxygenase-like lactoylglutathione lyase family enzyme